MTSHLTYKGYRAAISFDAEDAIITGRIAGLNDIIGFHAEDVRGLTEAFHDAVDDYVATCAGNADLLSSHTQGEGIKQMDSPK